MKIHFGKINMHLCFSPTGSDQEAVYQRYLRKQTAELEQLQQERQRLLEVQEELARMSQRSEPHKTVATQVQMRKTELDQL